MSSDPLTRAAGESSVGPGYNGAAPSILDRPAIRATQTAYVAAPSEDLIAWMIQVPLEDVFERVAGLPDISRTEVLTAGWGKAGDRRRVFLGDGHHAAEDLLVVEPPHRFSYQVWGFTNMARHFAAYAIGAFEVQPEEAGARVDWSYAFVPRNALARLPLTMFVRFQWRPYMATAMARLKQVAEAELKPHNAAGR